MPFSEEPVVSRAATPSLSPPPALSMRLSRFVLRRLGWRLQGKAPASGPLVVALAPHTSNWDFLLGLLILRAYGLRPAFLVKDSLMRFPVGLLFRFLGGVGVDRRQPGGMVAQGVARLRAGGMVGLLPKGTRRSGSWKSGFYHMAAQAPAPVLLLTMDAPRRTATAFGPYQLTGNLRTDMVWFRACMHGVVGVNPERTETVSLREEAE